METPFLTTTSHAARGGHPNELTRRTRVGELHRVRRGVYLPATTWAGATASDRFLLRIEAELLVRPRALASHIAALAVYDLPLVGPWQDYLDIVAPLAQARTVDGVTLRPIGTLPRDPHLPCVPLPVALVQTASLGLHETAVVAADAALHRGLTSRAALGNARLTWTFAPRRTSALLDAVDGSAESPGESLVRLILRGVGLEPRAQVPISTREGRFWVDFLVDGVVVVEFDGQVKYAGDATGSSLFAEKRREDALRAAGYDVVRVVWRDLSNPASIAGRVRAAMDRRLPHESADLFRRSG